MAPEELDLCLSQNNDPELINLWKIGMILYEIAYSCLPFPVEYLAATLKNKNKLLLNFPHSYRTAEFTDFLGYLIELEPRKRGGANWKLHVTLR